MNKTLKGILIALAIIFVAAAAYVVGRGQAGGQITSVVEFSINVDPSGSFTMTVDRPSASIKRGDPLSFILTAVPTGGFDAAVGLTVGGLPVGSFTLGTDILVPPAYSTKLTIDTTKLVSNTGYSVSVTGVDR